MRPRGQGAKHHENENNEKNGAEHDSSWKIAEIREGKMKEDPPVQSLGHAKIDEELSCTKNSTRNEDENKKTTNFSQARQPSQRS